MTVDDLKKFYEAKNDAELARILERDRSVIAYWRKGIPPRTQAMFEVMTEGKVKADRNKLSG
ncbi:hypothetical protein NNO95_03945 [Acinetobacter baumannii]|uniref:hypothetical protein n=1 Tax=Acinetobacter TaxID=469 RepID=UPI000660C883|nr:MULTISPECIES: hypothetical protein [Acinetobacter]MBU3083137.1 hypothetical protein [Acinetobacter seifertii]MCQ1053530.1 hypothetical protein [Acinetobacter baumannii]WEH90027.1 hypothetical protein PX669_07395 [Acinetobacter soli]